MAHIYWATFSWEAFATLAAGVGAVFAALVIGIRQVDIATRQAQILERQTWMNELGLRSALFDRRFAVYQSTNSFLLAIMTHAAEPPVDIQREFFHAVDKSKFLFAPTVSGNLEEIRKRSIGFFALKRRMDYTFKTEQHYGDGNAERELEFMEWLGELCVNLAPIFGDELNLSAFRGQEPKHEAVRSVKPSVLTFRFHWRNAGQPKPASR